MIISQKKLFFHTASIILEDEKISELFRSNKYSSIVALSYQKLDLPEFTSFSKPTLCIDLRKTEEEIMQGFNDTTRNEIRKTYKDEKLHIVMKDTVDIEFYNLYRNFEFSQGRVPTSIESLSGMLCFGAYIGGELVSGLYVIQSQPYLRIRSIFSKRLVVEQKEIYKQIAYATRRLVWEVCLWGKARNFISLDMASVNISNPKTESIARFKMSFGKDLSDEYIYIYKSATFAFFEKLVFVKLWLKRVLFMFKK